MDLARVSSCILLDGKSESLSTDPWFPLLDSPRTFARVKCWNVAEQVGIEPTISSLQSWALAQRSYDPTVLPLANREIRGREKLVQVARVELACARGAPAFEDGAYTGSATPAMSEDAAGRGLRRRIDYCVSSRECLGTPSSRYSI